MKIRLNLATSPLDSNRRFTVGAAIVGVAGLVAMLLLSWHAYSVRRSNTAFRIEQGHILADMDRLRSERNNLQAFFNQPGIMERRDRAAFLNTLIARRAFPWTKIFMDLERNLPAGVRVVSIEPTLEGDHVELRLTIGAAGDDSKVQFLKALEDSGEFSQIQVLNEAQVSHPTDSDRIVLLLVARYAVT